MVPWNKLPKDLQKAILAMIIMGGGTIACGRVGPMVCDPPPPPTTTSLPTPMICDPAPPPSRTAPPRPIKTPMICDAPPRPAITPTAVRQRHFQAHKFEMSSDPTLTGAGARGTVVDARGQPLAGLKVMAQDPNSDLRFVGVTDSNGVFMLLIPKPGDYLLMVEGDYTNGLRLNLKQHDLVIMEWVEIAGQSQLLLPLAEIRTVDITWHDGLTFGAETPWPDARYRWSASGGTLVEDGEHISWQPPVEPGRYLLQVVADWGQAGLAVDALTLIVEEDGSVTVS
jgi:Carboxypeptidase regulatory-like domain